MYKNTFKYGRFEWDIKKASANLAKHGIDFVLATLVFTDPNRIVAVDAAHGMREARYYCLGLVNHRVLTVRFTYRGEVIRIIGAEYWRKGRRFYEQENAKG